MPGTRLQVATKWLKITIAAAIVIPTTFFIGAIWRTYNASIALTEAKVENLIRINNEHAQKIFELTDSILARVDQQLEQSSALELSIQDSDFHVFLNKISDKYPHVFGISVLDVHGDRLVASEQLSINIQSRSRDFFQVHLKENINIFIGKVLILPSKIPVFTYSKKRIDKQGNFAGVVVAFIDQSYFENFYDDLIKRTPGSGSVLVKANGDILVQTPAAPIAPLGDTGPFPLNIKNIGQGVYEAPSGRDNRVRIFAFSKVGNYPVYTGAGILKSAVVAVWREEAILLAIFTFPSALLLAFMSWVALRRTNTAVKIANNLEDETQRRIAAEEALHQSQKLEAIGRLTGGIAHDFNNLLMVINNNAHLIRLTEPNSKFTPQIDSMQKAVQRGANLTKQLLSFASRRTPDHPAAVINLQIAFDNIYELIHRSLPSIIEIEMRLDPYLPNIKVDATNFEVALLNLAINAKDAMPIGGKLLFHARVATEEEISTPMVVIDVVDTGNGIDEKIIKNVFDPFFTTKDKGKGTGLGLSLVYGFCQQSGGKAEIQSKLYHGTKVSLFLPAVYDDVSNEPDSITHSFDAKQASLLLVEDNVDLAIATIPILENMNFKVDHVDSGDRALEILHKNKKQYKIVLSDVVMPGKIGGLALAKILRIDMPTLPVILMTGYMDQYEEARQDGFKILPKPVQLSRLVSEFSKIKSLKG